MSNRMVVVLLAVLCATAASGVVSTAAAQARASGAEWEVPRTPDGHPDLQGNWTNQSMTPFQRRQDQESPVYTPEEVVEREQGYVDRAITAAQASDPDRPPPEPKNIISAADSYNNVYFESGNRVAVVNGEPRASLITFPSNGRIPALTPEAQARRAERREFRSEFGQYDHPELRPLGERCLVSFGSNAGPPMLPNGGYNNNYTIVQTPLYVLFMAEMVHDARIIKIGDGPRLPPHIRPWMGDSWGHWEGDVLVVETTNIHPLQRFGGNSSENLTVIERFSRVDEETVLYQFTIDDPTTYTAPWGGEVPMQRFNDKLYEYACHEGNYALAAVLSGARYQERLEVEGASDSRRE